MPGIWLAGSGNTFTPLFKSDSASVGLIQMKSELIKVELHLTYALVEGEYDMFNGTDSIITMHVGYPLNGTYDQSVVSYVQVSELKALRVFIDDTAVDQIDHLDKYEFTDHTTDTSIWNTNEWYVWSCSFKPGHTKLKVFYLVNTNDAILRGGYNKAEGSAFTYVFDSGRAWKDVIEQGQVYIKLCDGIRLSDIHGAIPDLLSVNDSLLYYEFKNLEPKPENNLVLWYKRFEQSSVSDSSLVNNKELYAVIDSWETSSINIANAKIFVANNFALSSGSVFLWIGISIVGIVILIVLLIIFLFRKLRKKE